MTTKTIVIVGENLLAKELFNMFQDIGLYQVFHHYFTNNQIDVVIETTNLDLNEKKRNLQEMEAVISSNTLILSSSLQITATETASWLQHPNRLIGFGTFSNFKDGDLIEVALPLQADSSYLQSAKEVFSSIGQEIEQVEDEVGLVYPRILAMIINEAAFALMEQTATADAIDEAMKKGTNYPFGPFEWAEKIGLDDVYAVLTGLHREIGEERYRPAPLIKKLVYAGWVGGDTNKCFYHYQNRKVRSFQNERSGHY